MASAAAKNRRKQLERDTAVKQGKQALLDKQAEKMRRFEDKYNKENPYMEPAPGTTRVAAGILEATKKAKIP